MKKNSCKLLGFYSYSKLSSRSWKEAGRVWIEFTIQVLTSLNLVEESSMIRIWRNQQLFMFYTNMAL